MIDPELADPHNIWIVGEKSKISNAEQELTRLTDENMIGSSTFKPLDAMKVHFLKKHCWDEIKLKERSYKAEGVAVLDKDADSFKIEGTKAGRDNMILFLEKLAKNIDCKVRWFLFFRWLFDPPDILLN